MLNGHVSLHHSDAATSHQDGGSEGKVQSASFAPANAEESAARKKLPKLRYATMEDVDAIFALLEVMHAEIALAPMNPAKVRARILEAIGEGMVCLALSDGVPVGSCALTFSRFWYSDEVHLAEQWFFVHPDHRKTRHAARLMRFSNETGRQLGLKVMMGVVTTKETQRKCDFFGRYMRSVGQLFIGGAA